MKKILILFVTLLVVTFTQSQTNIKDYPIPEYSNEIYQLKKGSPDLKRLEKESSKTETKVKLMGMGGMDHGYSIDNERSPVRLSGGEGLVFIFYTGSNSSASNSQADSAMRANGMDPAMMSSQADMMSDPTRTTSLYDMSINKGKRNVLLQSVGLMGKSKKTSKKYTLSIKKIRDGYYEMVVDKPLPKGEYAFVVMSMGGMDQSYALFAFGVD